MNLWIREKRIGKRIPAWKRWGFGPLNQKAREMKAWRIYYSNDGIMLIFLQNSTAETRGVVGGIV